MKDFAIKLETKHLILEGISPAQLKAFFIKFSNDEIKEYFNIDEQQFQYFAEMNEFGMETYSISLFLFILRKKENNLAIGQCGFHTWNKKHNRAEIYYLLHKDEFKNKGFMKEALSKIISFGFNQMNLHRIQAMIDLENIPSKKLLEKYKFSFESIAREDYNVKGKQEDSYCYSLLKTEWNNQ